VTYRFN